MTGGNIAADMKRFSSQWINFEGAIDLEAKTSSKRAAAFLASIGSEAQEAFQAMDFETEEDWMSHT